MSVQRPTVRLTNLPSRPTNPTRTWTVRSTELLCAPVVGHLVAAFFVILPSFWCRKLRDSNSVADLKLGKGTTRALFCGCRSFDSSSSQRPINSSRPRMQKPRFPACGSVSGLVVTLNKRRQGIDITPCVVLSHVLANPRTQCVVETFYLALARAFKRKREDVLDPEFLAQSVDFVLNSTPLSVLRIVTGQIAASVLQTPDEVLQRSSGFPDLAGQRPRLSC